MPAPISSPIAGLFEQLGPLDLEDIPDLRWYLSWVPDLRSRRGRWYSLESLLAICACAVVAGATSIEAVCEWARNAPAQTRAALRLRSHPLGWRHSPSRRCLTGLLKRIDADALDRAVCAWLAAWRAAAEKDLGGDAPRAVDHDAAITLAQRHVSTKTNETGEFKALLAWLDIGGAVVTIDALHTVKAQAAWLVEVKGAHYVAIVKRGPKALVSPAQKPALDPDTHRRPGQWPQPWAR